jgi:PAS domain S-box-containing protein
MRLRILFLGSVSVSLLLVFISLKTLVTFHFLEYSDIVGILEYVSIIIFSVIFTYVFYFMLMKNNSETMLKKSLEDILDNSSLVSKTDSEGNITYVNDKFCNVSGYKRQELLGKNHRILKSEEHSDDFWADMYNTTLEYKTIWNDIIINEKKEGGKYFLNSWIKADFNEKGKHIGFTSVRQDITELTNYLEVIKNQEKEIRNVLNAIDKSNGVVEFKPDGTILKVNNNFLELVDYKLEEVVNKHHSIFIDKKTKNSKQYKIFWEDLANGKFKYGDFERYKKCGEKIIIHGTYNPIFDSDGNVIKILKVATDITESVNQKMELEKKNTYLEHAAKILRHDMHSGINTYIPRGIKSLKRRLTEEKIKELKIDTPLKLIEEGLAHAQKVYEGVKEFTKLVKKDSILDKQVFDLKEILVQYLKSTSYSDQVKIDALVEKSVNKSLFCTAIDNLIRNGLKYNDSRTKIIKIYMERKDVLVVEDNGRGMSIEEFEEYSKPYVRKETNKEAGSGLGLNICIAIMNEHGFTITCEKSKYGGTKLKIKL